MNDEKVTWPEHLDLLEEALAVAVKEFPELGQDVEPEEDEQGFVFASSLVMTEQLVGEYWESQESTLATMTGELV